MDWLDVAGAVLFWFSGFVFGTSVGRQVLAWIFRPILDDMEGEG